MFLIMIPPIDRRLDLAVYQAGMLDAVFSEWEAFWEDPGQYEAQTRALAAEWTLSDPYRMAQYVCGVLDKVRMYRRVLGDDMVFDHQPDVLMGVATVNKPVDVEISVGGILVQTLSLTPGEPELVLTNNIIPLVALPYHAVELKMSTHCSVSAQYALLPRELRHCMAAGNWKTESMYVSHGMAALEPAKGYEFTRFPDWIPVWRRMLEEKRRQLDVYEEELIMQACRPERLWQIGID